MTEAFERAVEEAKILKVRPGKDELSGLYGLFKQATKGDLTTERPGWLDIAGKAKWDAWNPKKGLTQDEAKQQYVDLVEKLKKKYGMLDVVSQEKLLTLPGCTEQLMANPQ